MNTKDRQVKESPIYQGVNEEIAYTLNTLPWGGSPTSSTVAIFDSEDADVSSVNLQGSPSVDGNTITTPIVKDLTQGERYRMEIRWVNSGNTLEAFLTITGQA